MSKAKDNELYEIRDIQARPLLIFLTGLTIMGISVFLAVGSMESSMTGDLREARGSDHPMASQRVAPRAPLLQAHPTLEIEALRKSEEETLSTFGWVDPQEGIVRLPIELAKQAFLARQAEGSGK